MKIKKVVILIVLIMITIIPNSISAEVINNNEVLEPADTSGYDIHNDVEFNAGGTYHPITIAMGYIIIIGASLGIITFGVKKYWDKRSYER